MKELNKIKKDDVVNYRELKLSFLNSKIPKDMYAIYMSHLTSNQKAKLYSYWTRYSTIINTASDKETFVERENDIKEMGIAELSTILYTKKAISLRRSAGNPFIQLLRPTIEKEYCDWVRNIREEYGFGTIKTRPVRGRRKSPYRLYIYPDYNRFSTIYDVERSIKVLYGLAESYESGEIDSANDTRDKLCALCKEMGHVPSFQTATTVKLYKSIKDYYSLYLNYKSLGDDLFSGASFISMSKKYKLAKLGIYDIKQLYAVITIHVSIVALYLRTRGIIVSRVFNINYSGH